MSYRVALTLVLAFPIACDEPEPPGAPAEPPGATNDGGPEGRRADRSRIAELAGSWTGHADTRDYGRVVAVLTISESGVVVAQLVGKAPSVNRQVEITSWDGEQILARDQTGARYRVSAVLDGNKLTVEVPTIGPVDLRRGVAKPRQGDAPP